MSFNLSLVNTQNNLRMPVIWMHAAGMLALLTCQDCLSQSFQDGDVQGDLYTNHVGGYLGHGVSMADFNGDGHDDLTFTQFEGELYLYAGDGQGNFQPINLGVSNTGGEGKCPLWADFDGDGDQDLLITQRLAPNRLYARMDDGLLQEVPNAGGMAGSEAERTFGASVADYDQDGRLDVYMCHYHTPQTNSEQNVLYRGVSGTDLSMAFEDVTAAAGVGNGVKQSFQSTWIDVDRDGLLDLHVINDRTFWPDALYRNLGNGTFQDMAAEWGIGIGIYSMSSSFGDFDNDLDWDILVANGADLGNYFLRCEGTPFLIGEGVGNYFNYANVASEAGVLLDNLSWGAMWFDFNNDGWQDLYIGTGTSLYTDYPTVTNYYPNSTNGLFINPGGTLPLLDVSSDINDENELTFCVAYGDHNEDGALDFVSHRMGARAKLFNGVPSGKHWLSVLLKPELGHPDGIGTSLTLWNDGVPQSRTVTCGSQYMSQNSRRIHFGLNSATSVDSLVIQWPGGDETTLALDQVDQRIEVNEAGLISNSAPGCTYPMACNYDASAVGDDGSCDMSCTCGQGTVWDASTQQCVVFCPADHDGNGVVGAGDLILFLTWFGDTCAE